MVSAGQMDVGQRILELQAESLSFTSEVRSLQRRLAEVRSQRAQDVDFAPAAQQHSRGPKSGSNDGRSRFGAGPCKPQSAASHGADGGHSTCGDGPCHGRSVASDDCGPANPPSLPAAAAVSRWARPEMASPRSASGAPQRHTMAATLAATASTAAPQSDDGSSSTQGPASEPPVPMPMPPALPNEGNDPDASSCLSQRDVNLLKNENHRLTEQLVEASLESVQSFASFSNDRHALLQVAQDLKLRVQKEQAERLQLSTIHNSVEKLAEQNLLLAERLMHCQSRPPSPMPGGGGSIEALLAAQRREIGELRREVEEHTKEREQLQQFIKQQTAQANATIMELARRNLELEEGLRRARMPLDRRPQDRDYPPGGSGDASVDGLGRCQSYGSGSSGPCGSVGQAAGFGGVAAAPGAEGARPDPSHVPWRGDGRLGAEDHLREAGRPLSASAAGGGGPLDGVAAAMGGSRLQGSGGSSGSASTSNLSVPCTSGSERPPLALARDTPAGPRRSSPPGRAAGGARRIAPDARGYMLAGGGMDWTGGSLVNDSVGSFTQAGRRRAGANRAGSCGATVDYGTPTVGRGSSRGACSHGRVGWEALKGTGAGGGCTHDVTAEPEPEHIMAGRFSPPRSPFIGTDGRYGGRGVGCAPKPSTAAGLRQSEKLQRTLDTTTVEMRRMQQRALSAASL